MQKFIMIITILILSISNGVSAMTTNEYVNALELKLFGTTYKNQSLDERVDRIEMQIYDNSYSGSAEERLSKIDKIYPKSEFETGKLEPVETLNNQTDDYYEQDYSESSNYNNYPIVSEIEENIYKKNYKGEDIYKRLARLEQELYGNVKSEESLQERVERLKSVLPKKHYNRFAAKDLGFKDFGLQEPSSYSQDKAYDISSILSELEIETFNKMYSNDNVNHRLERLEQFYYGKTSSEKSADDRIQKLASIVMSTREMKDYFPTSKGAQWAGILMNLLIIGLGFLI
ncbi:MAG: hypothetical protein MJ180_02140 [Candidatus Gastranaerophilales bacterium]|nr:hypothetical protein [Candidatus Gastranaerophilales bacterium]